MNKNRILNSIQIRKAQPQMVPNSINSDQKELLEIGRKINGRYVVQSFLGEGSFGLLHIAVDLKTLNKVAIKLEKRNVQRSQILHEHNVYNALSRKKMHHSSSFTDVPVPHLHWVGSIDGRRGMVMELFGANLEDLFILCGRKFRVATILMIAERMLFQIENLHKHGFVHRDLKPENFVCGRGTNSNNIYLVDFGLTRTYLDSQGKHVPNKFDSSSDITGTARYCSANAHMSIKLSRRDDLESLGYILVYFYKGQLPWMGLKTEDKVPRQYTIGRVKLQTSLQDLCRGMDSAFLHYLTACRNLRYTEEPNYESLRNIFRQLAKKQRVSYNWNYDWNTTT
jgi:serine/threonine protein kinase